MCTLLLSRLFTCIHNNLQSTKVIWLTHYYLVAPLSMQTNLLINIKLQQERPVLKFMS